jgi:4-hydroxybutyrate dehydrogenase
MGEGTTCPPMALIQYLTSVHFDFGAVRLLHAETERLGIRAPLVITDRGVVRAGLLEQVARAWPRLGTCPCFDATPENPTEDAVADAAARYRAEGCDGVIAIGGGSPIDLAKGVALTVTHDGPLEPFAAVAGGMERITPAVAPVIAIPTTAGTGSEVGRAAVIVMRSGRKVAVVSPHLFPRVALCDPELTLTLPPRLTAGTGMDAIAHCIETFLSPLINPPAEAIALDGLVRGVAHIERACVDGQDRTARWEMMMASLEGGLTFQKGLGAVHAMSHPLGALRDVTIHHGTANAILLPTALRFNLPVAEAKYARLRAALGLAPEADLPRFFQQLARRLGLPVNLKSVGLLREKIPALAEAAALDFSARTNPRPADAATYRQLYEEAYE